MAKEKKVEQITSMDVDFAQWYTDVVKKTELIDYTSVKGCMKSLVWDLQEPLETACLSM